MHIRNRSSFIGSASSVYLLSFRSSRHPCMHLAQDYRSGLGSSMKLRVLYLQVAIVSYYGTFQGIGLWKTSDVCSKYFEIFPPPGGGDDAGGCFSSLVLFIIILFFGNLVPCSCTSATRRFL